MPCRSRNSQPRSQQQALLRRAAPRCSSRLPATPRTAKRKPSQDERHTRCFSSPCVRLRRRASRTFRHESVLGAKSSPPEISSGLSVDWFVFTLRRDSPPLNSSAFAQTLICASLDMRPGATPRAERRYGPSSSPWIGLVAYTRDSHLTPTVDRPQRVGDWVFSVSGSETDPKRSEAVVRKDRGVRLSGKGSDSWTKPAVAMCDASLRRAAPASPAGRPAARNRTPSGHSLPTASPRPGAILCRS